MNDYGICVSCSAKWLKRLRSPAVKLGYYHLDFINTSYHTVKLILEQVFMAKYYPILKRLHYFLYHYEKTVIFGKQRRLFPSWKRRLCFVYY